MCTCTETNPPEVIEREWRTAADRLADTLDLIAAYGEHPTTRSWVALILDAKGVGSATGDELIVPIAEWVRDNIAYLPEQGEILQTPATTWESGRGDCDDQVILLCALLHSVGIEARPLYWHWGPDVPAHHMAAVARPDQGRWIHMDPTEPTEVGELHPDFYWSFDGGDQAMPTAFLGEVWDGIKDGAGWVWDQVESGWGSVTDFLDQAWEDMQSADFWEDLAWAVAGCIESYFTGNYPVGTSVARRVVDDDTPPDFYNPAADAASGGSAYGGGATACADELRRTVTRRASYQQLQRLQATYENLEGMSLDDAEAHLRAELGDQYDQAMSELTDRVLAAPDFQQAIAMALQIAVDAVGGDFDVVDAVRAQLNKQRPAIVGEWLDSNGYSYARINQGEYPRELISAAIYAGGWQGPVPSMVARDLVLTVLNGLVWRNVPAGQINNEAAALRAVDREIESMELAQIQHYNVPAEDPTVGIGRDANRWASAAMQSGTPMVSEAMIAAIGTQPRFQAQYAPIVGEAVIAEGPGLGGGGGLGRSQLDDIQDQSSGQLLGMNTSTTIGLGIAALVLFWAMRK